MTPTLKTYPDRNALAERLADDFVAWLSVSGRDKDFVNIALSGGSTPLQFFSALLARSSKINWQKVRFFWVDERCVPPEHPESNFGAAYRTLLELLPISESNYFRIRGEDDPVKESKRYAGLIWDQIPVAVDVPQFDIVILGIGPDGHTASIFPHEISLWLSENICTVGTHPETKQKRITFTGKLINAASKVVFHVSGREKSGIVYEVVRQAGRYREYPASLVNPLSGELFWYLDADAAGNLKER